MKKTALTSILFLITIFSFGQQTEKGLAYFDYDKFSLTQKSKETIDGLFDKLKSKEIFQIELNGHTDNKGNISYNLNLSQSRLKAVQQYLFLKGVAYEKIKLNNLGSSQPLFNNESEEGRKKNRVVEIIITYKNKVEAPATISTTIDTTTKPYTQVKVSLSNNPNIQRFFVSPKKEIVITGKNGTVVTFPKNSFIEKNGGPIKNDVTIELLEVYSKSDMILNNIYTTSNDKLLETSGMFNIKVFSQNTEVFLKPNASYQVEFPTNNKQKDMSVFYGDTSTHHVNWQQADRNFTSDIVFLANDKELSKYVFNSTKLGWINCDHFLKNYKTTDLLVGISDTDGVSLCLVFRNINSVMGANGYKNGKVVFLNVPINETVSLVAFRKKAGKFSFASKTITIQKNETETLVLETVTEEELQKRVKQFD